MSELADQRILFGDACAPPSGKPRNRDREGAGKSEFSWKKHDVLSRIVSAQAHALHHGIRFKSGRGIIIDMHAGDGEGVEQPQMFMFGANPSRTTSELAIALSRNLSADVVLCEKNKERREVLAQRWPDVPVLRDHKLAVSQVTGRHSWALIINDPNGPRDHGVEHMQAIAGRVPISDFVIVLNEGALRRIAGVTDERFRDGMSSYRWMVDHREWGVRLGRKKIAVSRLIHQSAGFHYRVLLAANVVAATVERKQIVEKVIQCR